MCAKPRPVRGFVFSVAGGGISRQNPPMSSGHLLVLGASVIWILFCMRFWYAIEQEHTWQRRFIAIGAGIGGGLIYLIGTMMLQMLKEPPPPVVDVETEIRVSAGKPAEKSKK